MIVRERRSRPIRMAKGRARRGLLRHMAGKDSGMARALVLVAGKSVDARRAA